MSVTTDTTVFDIERKVAEQVTVGSDAEFYYKVKTLSGSAGSLQLKTGTYGALSVTTSPVQVKAGVSNLANRIIVSILPTNGRVYFGWDNLVTSSTGTPIESGEMAYVAATDDLDIFLVAASGIVDVRFTEASDQ